MNWPNNSKSGPSRLRYYIDVILDSYKNPPEYIIKVEDKSYSKTVQVNVKSRIDQSLFDTALPEAERLWEELYNECPNSFKPRICVYSINQKFIKRCKDYCELNEDYKYDIAFTYKNYMEIIGLKSEKKFDPNPKEEKKKPTEIILCSI